MSRKVIFLIAWILVLQLMGAGLGLMTAKNISPWYALLDKPMLTPPNYLFALVWPILYILIAISGYCLWQRRDEAKAQDGLVIYFLQLLMNWMWTPLFFSLHLLGFSFIWLLLLVVVCGWYIFYLRKDYKLSAFLFIPYFLWLLFAAYLNGSLWFINS